MKCPVCKEEIVEVVRHLVYDVGTKHPISKDGEVNLGTSIGEDVFIEFNDGEEGIWYECPRCHKPIIDDSIKDGEIFHIGDAVKLIKLFPADPWVTGEDAIIIDKKVSPSSRITIYVVETEGSDLWQVSASRMEKLDSQPPPE